MALVKCHERGREISTEAKTCPQCGARNKSYKSLKIIKYGGTFVVSVLLLSFIYHKYETDLNPNIPECNSEHGRKVFIETFDNGPYAKNNNLRAISIRAQKEISSGSAPEDRVCEVTFRINDGTDKTYEFSFDKDERSGYIIRGKAK